MRSRIFCEGHDDVTLVQYLFRRLYNLRYDSKEKKLYSDDCRTKIQLVDMQSIYNTQKQLSDYILLSVNDEVVDDKAIFILDNDSESEVLDTIEKIKSVLDSYSCSYDGINIDRWNDVSFNNIFNGTITLKMYIIVLPKGRNGALETFLLDNLKELDCNGTEASIIDSCEQFVQRMSEHEGVKSKGYLFQRRYVIKAKFNVYFCIATPNKAFSQRQELLKSVKWEKFDLMKSTFACFKDIINC